MKQTTDVTRRQGLVSLEESRRLLEHREIWTDVQMRRLVEKERMRAGRRELPFALAVWDFLDKSQRRDWNLLVREASATLRLTDEIGQWEHGIATLLTDTDLVGAEVACEKMRQRLELQGIDVSYEIYVYPQSQSTGSSEKESRHDRDSHDSDDSGTSHGQATQAKDGACAQTVKSVDVWFERPTTGAKRAFDIFASISALIVLSPLLLIVAAMVKLTSRGPIIFTQLREGRGGRIFKMYKFRTMCVNAEALQAELRKFSEQDGPAFKMTNDPRLTPIGRILRKTCIDELPQLINILRGEMSVVGPRPLPVGESQACATWQRRRLDITPGLTCSWQAEAARQVTFEEWMRLDLRYSKQPTLREDLRLIVRTATTLVKAKASV